MINLQELKKEIEQIEGKIKPTEASTYKNSVIILGSKWVGKTQIFNAIKHIFKLQEKNFSLDSSGPIHNQPIIRKATINQKNVNIWDIENLKNKNNQQMNLLRSKIIQAIYNTSDKVKLILIMTHQHFQTDRLASVENQIKEFIKLFPTQQKRIKQYFDQTLLIINKAEKIENQQPSVKQCEQSSVNQYQQKLNRMQHQIQGLLKQQKQFCLFFSKSSKNILAIRKQKQIQKVNNYDSTQSISYNTERKQDMVSPWINKKVLKQFLKKQFNKEFKLNYVPLDSGTKNYFQQLKITKYNQIKQILTSYIKKIGKIIASYKKQMKQQKSQTIPFQKYNQRIIELKVNLNHFGKKELINQQTLKQYLVKIDLLEIQINEKQINEKQKASAKIQQFFYSLSCLQQLINKSSKIQLKIFNLYELNNLQQEIMQCLRERANYLKKNVQDKTPGFLLQLRSNIKGKNIDLQQNYQLKQKFNQNHGSQDYNYYYDFVIKISQAIKVESQYSHLIKQVIQLNESLPAQFQIKIQNISEIYQMVRNLRKQTSTLQIKNPKSLQIQQTLIKHQLIRQQKNTETLSHLQNYKKFNNQNNTYPDPNKQPIKIPVRIESHLKPRTISVYGSSIILSEILKDGLIGKHKQKIDNQSCQQVHNKKYYILKIYSNESIELDQSIQCNNLTIILIAPLIKVTQQINFEIKGQNGKQGTSPKQLNLQEKIFKSLNKNSKKQQLQRYSGEKGYPGGNLIIFTANFENGQKLSVDVSGGDGGNGGKGLDGYFQLNQHDGIKKYYQKLLMQYSKIIKNNVIQGETGGNGGKGGQGGQKGSVQIMRIQYYKKKQFTLMTEQFKVKVRSQSGRNGQSGQAGKRGYNILIIDSMIPFTKKALEFHQNKAQNPKKQHSVSVLPERCPPFDYSVFDKNYFFYEWQQFLRKEDKNYPF